MLLLLARRNGFGPVHKSKVTRLSENENPRENNVSCSLDIRNAKGLILLPRVGGPNPKSASPTRAAERFQALPSPAADLSWMLTFEIGFSVYESQMQDAQIRNRFLSLLLMM